MINWVLIDSQDRATNFGVGTFIQEFSQSMSALDKVRVYIVHIGKLNMLEVTIIEKSDITQIYIPYHFSFLYKNVDSKRNLEKFAERVVDCLQPVFNAKENLVFHLNYLFQYYIGKALKKRFVCNIIFTRHLILQDLLSSNESVYDPEQDAYKFFDHVVCVTQHGRDDLLNNLKIKSRKIYVIYNGLDISCPPASQKEIEEIRASILVQKSEKLLLYAGRIDSGKGVECLIAVLQLCLKTFPDCRLVIAGDGDLTNILGLSKDIQNKVTLLGYIPRNELLKLYSAADLGIIPSIVEQCSYVALEMLQRGLPVVATAVGGLKEIFQHGKNAYLVDLVHTKSGIYPDVMAMSKYITDLLLDNQKALNFSNNAKKHAEINFTGTEMCNQYLKLINKAN